MEDKSLSCTVHLAEYNFIFSCIGPPYDASTKVHSALILMHRPNKDQTDAKMYNSNIENPLFHGSLVAPYSVCSVLALLDNGLLCASGFMQTYGSHHDLCTGARTQGFIAFAYYTDELVFLY